ncbi:MAG: hypothetical protein DRQ43_04720 [Gammaproteobacteria bacterium]|nr:MAG: hypothetical protein DRQ43_04720 [Gammaproteobacteria bacterium]
MQKGIAEYKKPQKGKARELDKLKKKIIHQQHNSTVIETSTYEGTKCKPQWLPWTLLVFSWMIMAIFIMGGK